MILLLMLIIPRLLLLLLLDYPYCNPHFSATFIYSHSSNKQTKKVVEKVETKFVVLLFFAHHPHHHHLSLNGFEAQVAWLLVNDGFHSCTANRVGESVGQ